MLVFFRPWGRLNARHLYTVVLGCDKTESHAWSQIWTLLRGRLRNTLDEIKKTQKHNAKIGLSFERFQKWWFCKWWYYWKAVANCVEAALEGSRRIIPSCPTGGSQCATYTADWLALLTTKWLSVPGSEKTSMNVLTTRLVLLMYFLPAPKRRGRLSEARFIFIPSQIALFRICTSRKIVFIHFLATSLATIY